ncbi:MAG TPA: hypothetical protein VIU12_12985 [Chryseolinea sp.]
MNAELTQPLFSGAAFFSGFDDPDGHGSIKNGTFRRFFPKHYNRMSRRYYAATRLGASAIFATL